MRGAFTSSIRQAACGSTALLLLLSSAPSAAAAPQPGGIIVSALAGRPKASFLERIRAGEMGGVILVGRWTPGEMTAATQQLRAAGCATGRPLLLMVDQEGGYARRLTWAPPRAHRRPARATGTGVDARRSDRRGNRAPARRDRHRSRTRLQGLARSDGARPLPRGHRRASKARHGLEYVVSALDGTGVAAVFSRPIVTGLLRGSFGFGGVVVSDALDATVPYAVPHAPARALAAASPPPARISALDRWLGRTC
jgi:hypothetical protein